MVSTLIVRDVTLAVNGNAETRSDAGEFLRERMEAVSAFDDATVQECIEVLQPVAVGDEVEPEVLESLMLIGMARPEICAQFQVSPVPVGRRFAAVLDGRGETDRAIAVLELLAERFPGSRGIERDLAALMRRRGKVEDLVERYLARANHLLKTGRTTEAIDFLREVLLLDRSRKDVARMIRDLRFQEVDEAKGGRRRRRTAFLTLALSATVSLAVLREIQLKREFEALPSAAPGDVAGLRARLEAMETFVARYPVWHGSLEAVAQRTSLRVELERISQEMYDAEERRREEELQALETADLARELGLLHAGSRDFEAALGEFRRALEHAPASWSHRGRVERDIQAITEWLEDNR